MTNSRMYGETDGFIESSLKITRLFKKRILIFMQENSFVFLRDRQDDDTRGIICVFGCVAVYLSDCLMLPERGFEKQAPTGTVWTAYTLQDTQHGKIQVRRLQVHLLLLCWLLVSLTLWVKRRKVQVMNQRKLQITEKTFSHQRSSHLRKQFLFKKTLLFMQRRRRGRKDYWITRRRGGERNCHWLLRRRRTKRIFLFRVFHDIQESKSSWGRRRGVLRRLLKPSCRIINIIICSLSCLEFLGN